LSFLRPIDPSETRSGEPVYRRRQIHPKQLDRLLPLR
jgi:hypothetical protein